MASNGEASDRILVVAPTGADAANIRQVLRRAHLPAEICADIRTAVRLLPEGAGALLITEDALISPERAILAGCLHDQPAWSDIPVLLLSNAASIGWWAVSGADVLGVRTNVTLVERPLRASILVAATAAALRARRRQYQLRDLLAEREAILQSLESRVAERTAKLQELVAELESFSYSVSHDLRAPLRIIAGYARSLIDDFAAVLPEEANNRLERIARTAERMDRLTQDVLAYTRLTRADIILESVDLDSLVNELLDQYPVLVAARSQIEVRFPLGRVVGHAPSLTQALSNLLENALKFVPAGRVPHVVIATQARGARRRILLRDNGIGIAPEHQKKIFGIFERIADRSVPGTGIGLAIAKKAAERMGGTIGLRSTPGKGSTFWLEFARPAEAPAPKPGKRRRT